MSAPAPLGCWLQPTGPVQEGGAVFPCGQLSRYKSWGQLPGRQTVKPTRQYKSEANVLSGQIGENKKDGQRTVEIQLPGGRMEWKIKQKCPFSSCDNNFVDAPRQAWDPLWWQTVPARRCWGLGWKNLCPLGGKVTDSQNQLKTKRSRKKNTLKFENRSNF